MYIAYLDEFGHIGPFTGRNQQKYNENPLFGLGGIVLPATEARRFATWCFQLKSDLLGWEIERSGMHMSSGMQVPCVYSILSTALRRQMASWYKRLSIVLVRMGWAPPLITPKRYP